MLKPLAAFSVAVLAVASVACNKEGQAREERNRDTTTIQPVTPDTTSVRDTTADTIPARRP